MKLNLTYDAEMLEDLRTSQQIIPVVRWFLIATALFVTNYRAGDMDNTQLAVNNVAIWGLTVYNAFLHARAFIGKPLGLYPVLLASIMDVVVITALLGVSDDRFGNNYFVFYYAAVFGFGMVFPPLYTLLFTSASALAYAILSMTGDPGLLVRSDDDEKRLITRLVVMFAIAAGASAFWFIERARRTKSVQDQLDILQAGLSDDVGGSGSSPQPGGDG